MPAGYEADALRAARQHINILTVGSPNGIGGFFPNGLNGVITSPVGFNMTDPGTEDIPKYAISSGQARPHLHVSPTVCLHMFSVQLLVWRDQGWQQACNKTKKAFPNACVLWGARAS
jgi:hypothetical protein